MVLLRGYSFLALVQECEDGLGFGLITYDQHREAQVAATHYLNYWMKVSIIDGICLWLAIGWDIDEIIVALDFQKVH
ncbi:hypothetical protein VNO77_44413 [Canavalia gladiata]|uniref:Uncharacterized protein n=1 Tax=Canavalia gladiata TaxID=3824 RepID=A0AAN9PNS9_CANGL